MSEFTQPYAEHVAALAAASAPISADFVLTSHDFTITLYNKVVKVVQSGLALISHLLAQ